VTPQTSEFGKLLQQYRRKAGLSQDELAEQAGLSRRGVADLERGARKWPHPANARRLCEALGLSESDRAQLLAAAVRQDSKLPVGPQPAPPAGRAPVPMPLTSFIGRQQELASLRRLVGSERLVTLTGTGGSGKTRLAQEVVRDISDGGVTEVGFVELASIRQPELVPRALALAVGLAEVAGEPIQTSLVRYIGDRRMLLVLDNCEHLVQSCATLAETLLESCAHLTILATSREALRIRGEHLVQVPPLSVPPREDLSEIELFNYDSVRLFNERSVAVQPDFAITRENALAVAQICARVDGLPLAVELAAARSTMLSAQQINDRLRDRFGLLTAGYRTAPARHQTLQAMVDWSYDSLAKPEQALLRRLSIFAGGWTLEAAEFVCGTSPVEPAAVLPVLAELASKSLIVVDQRSNATRYGLLETLREYALVRLTESGELGAVRDRHAAYYADLADRYGYWRDRPLTLVGVDILEREHDNLRAALDHLRSDPARALKMAYRLIRLWYNRGYLTEGLGTLQNVLGLPGAETPSVERVEALFGAGVMARYAGSLELARRFHEEGLALAGRIEARSEAAWHLSWLGVVARVEGDAIRARTLGEAALAEFRSLGETFGIAQTLNHLASAVQVDDPPLAGKLLSEVLALVRPLNDPWKLAWALIGAAQTAVHSAAYDSASALLGESLSVIGEVGSPPIIAAALEMLAEVEIAEHRPVCGLRLLAAAASLRSATGAGLAGASTQQLERVQAVARAEAGSAADKAWDQGRYFGRKEAVAYALSLVESRSSSDARGGGHVLVRSATAGTG